MSEDVVEEDEYKEELESCAENVWRTENGYRLDEYWFEDLLLRGYE